MANIKRYHHHRPRRSRRSSREENPNVAGIILIGLLLAGVGVGAYFLLQPQGGGGGGGGGGGAAGKKWVRTTNVPANARVRLSMPFSVVSSTFQGQTTDWGVLFDQKIAQLFGVQPSAVFSWKNDPNNPQPFAGYANIHPFPTDWPTDDPAVNTSWHAELSSAQAVNVPASSGFTVWVYQ